LALTSAPGGRFVVALTKYDPVVVNVLANLEGSVHERLT
jgi:hypothetical protein